jgi:hypothetical protein
MLRLRRGDEAEGDAALKVRAMASAKKSEAQVSQDLRDEADRIDDLAHALADHFRRKVVVVMDDQEVVVEPRTVRRRDS